MIDFRYHLVSIVAVFLALAVGIVMGTTLLQEPAIESARKVSDELQRTNNDLRAELDTWRGREAGNDSFVTTQTPMLVASDLVGQKVVLVEAPGYSPTYREAQQQVLTQAGATVTGHVILKEKFFDPKSQGVMDGVVNTLKPNTMTFAPTATAYDKVSTLLAATIMTADPAQAGTANPDTDSVLSGLETASMLSTDGDPGKRATLAVMFAPEKIFDGEDAVTQNAALVTLISGLDQGGKGSVLAGTAATAAAAGGAITALRDDSDAAKVVSTVDTLDMPAGRVVVIYALREQLAGKTGQYGIGSGISAFQPAVPTATSTPTQSGS